MSHPSSDSSPSVGLTLSELKNKCVCVRGVRAWVCVCVRSCHVKVLRCLRLCRLEKYVAISSAPHFVVVEVWKINGLEFHLFSVDATRANSKT